MSESLRQSFEPAPPAAEVWPRWIDAEGWPHWSHDGCEHDGTNGDREACRRLNRHRKPGTPEPEWREALDLSRGKDARAFLNRFVSNMEAVREEHYASDEQSQMHIAELLIALAKAVREELSKQDGVLLETTPEYMVLQLMYAITAEYADGATI